MRVHAYGKELSPVVVMLPASFCNADSMQALIDVMKEDFYVLAVDYTGQYVNPAEKAVFSREGEAAQLVEYIQKHWINAVALVYGQSLGAEIGMELISQLEKLRIPVQAGFFDGGLFVNPPKLVLNPIVKKLKSILENLKGKSLEDALEESSVMKFSGGNPERYRAHIASALRTIPVMSEETLDREIQTCVTFTYPQVRAQLTFFYSKEEVVYKLCHGKVAKAYPHARFWLVSGYGHVGYPAEHLQEYTGWMKDAAKRYARRAR